MLHKTFKSCGAFFKTKTMGEHWKVFARLLKHTAESKNISIAVLAEGADMSRSTIYRFFNLEFCLRFDYVLRIIKALELNIFIESRDSDTELNKLFEKAMDDIGQRSDNLPKN